MLRMSNALALAELEPSAGAALTVLFAFDHAGIARKVTVCLERCVAVRINLRQCAGKTVQARCSLTVQTATGHVDKDIKLVVV